jgi:acyl dehydratase
VCGSIIRYNAARCDAADQDGGDVSKEYFFDDLTVGQVVRSARSIRLDRERILDFAREYDPQPQHLGEEAAAGSHFGVFCASGWQTAATTMRLVVETMPIPGGGMGAGVEKIAWLRPVLPDDELRVEIEVLAKRVSKSRPDKGVVTTRTTTFNQDGNPVQTFDTVVLMPRRPGG